MSKAVIFDLDGTLLDRQASIVRFVRQQHNCYKPLQSAAAEDYVRSFIELDDNGNVWKDWVYQQLIEKYNIQDVTWQTLLQDYVDNFSRACICFPGTVQTLKRLQSDGYLLGMITNGRSPFQERAIEAIGIDYFFASILVSEAVGIRKPDRAIFDRMLLELNVRADEAVFVGDSPESDIAGAQSAGIKAIWKYSDYWKKCAQADATCHLLTELPEMIRQIL